jgi:hypothetical protein
VNRVWLIVVGAVVGVIVAVVLVTVSSRFTAHPAV